MRPPMHVAFINENKLGHLSYLPRFVKALQDRPELGIQPHTIDVFPLPDALNRMAYTSGRFLWRYGLDFQPARAYLATSRYARQQLDELRKKQPIDAAVVNTQFVGLSLAALADELPLFVTTDNTLAQAIRADGWWGRHPEFRPFLPLTMAPIKRLERALLRRAHHLLPLADSVRRSMIAEYRLPPEKIHLLPPSMTLPPRRLKRPLNARPQILFMGNDFERKGGPELLECFRRHFADRCDLHLLTKVAVPSTLGVHVHQDVVANSGAWHRRWQEADIFVLPSRVDLVPNVLVEALAFEVPVIASDVGAVREMLAGGTAGLLLTRGDEDALAAAISQILSDPVAARQRSELGRRHAETHFDLQTNVARLSHWLHEARAAKAAEVRLDSS